MADLELENNAIKSYCNLALENLKGNLKEVMRKALAKEKDYRRTIFKKGEQTVFFKSDERECNGYKYIVYVKSYGKKDYAKRGLIFYIVTPFTLFGKHYYIHYAKKFERMDVYTQHFFDRYIERHLKDGRNFNNDVIGRYFKDTDCITMFGDVIHNKYSDCVYASTLIGTCCGRRITDKILLYSTFINEDTITKGTKKVIFDAGNQLFDKLFDNNGKRIKFLN